MTFSMVHIEFKTPALVSWARAGRHSLADMEYLVHSAMRLSFGKSAPQPFEVFDNGDKTLKVLGYLTPQTKNSKKIWFFAPNLS